MRLGGRRESANVKDTRGMSPGKMAAGGGIGAIIMTVIVFLMSGGDFSKALETFGKQKQAAARKQQQAGPATQTGERPAEDDPMKIFIAKILGGTEDCWTKVFKDNPQFCRRQNYRAPQLQIFGNLDGSTASVNTACGQASSAVGPFYCPGDQKVYIDPVFFHDLGKRHNTEGDFAYAYVIAHEVGHHVQNLLGYSDQVNEVRRRGTKLQANKASIRLELQADYLAGVWANHDHKNFGSLEQGDIDEALNAAYNIGDDVLQKQATGYVKPDHFTHGTAAQRVRWFRKGLESGDIRGCDALFDASVKADDL
ncbi:neutral zinc metallopeptidase [bacterium]|nr:neutral zinc metallopeptidase [bacterium]